MRIKTEEFRGTADRFYLESNIICFGPRPERDDEVEQHFELASTGIGRLRRYTMGDASADEMPMREVELCVGAERARKILDAIGEYFLLTNLSL